MRVRASVLAMGGRFLLSVTADVRDRAAVTAGDTVDVDIELDTEPREVSIPSDFGRALQDDASAKRFFDRLSYSQKR